MQWRVTAARLQQPTSNDNRCVQNDWAGTLVSQVTKQAATKQARTKVQPAVFREVCTLSKSQIGMRPSPQAAATRRAAGGSEFGGVASECTMGGFITLGSATLSAPVTSARPHVHASHQTMITSLKVSSVTQNVCGFSNRYPGQGEGSRNRNIGMGVNMNIAVICLSSTLLSFK